MIETVGIVKLVAERLADYKYVVEELTEKNNYILIGAEKFYPNDPLTLSHGIPALCLLFSELGMRYPDEKWLDICNSYVKELVDHIKNGELISSSLFSGIAGIGLSIKASSFGGIYYNKLLKSLNEQLFLQLEERINLIKNKRSLEMFDYDAIEGLAGIANYLLLDITNSFSKVYLQEIIQYFISISDNYHYKGQVVPKWHIRRENLFSEEERSWYEDGIFNIGLAHGITAPLIILCKAYEKGLKINGQLEAIRNLTIEIVNLKLKDTNSWGGMIGFNEYLSKEQNLTYARDAWCYGTPGVAYSLLTASFVLNDKNLYELSCQSMKDIIHSEKGNFSPTFCHGYAGLAYIFRKFYYKTNDNDFLDESNRLKGKILHYYDKNMPFGFSNIEIINKDEKKINSIGLLDGVTGTLLTLLSLTEKNDNSLWDVAFLLND